jgi:hypothetical protein
MIGKRRRGGVERIELNRIATHRLRLVRNDDDIVNWYCIREDKLCLSLRGAESDVAIQKPPAVCGKQTVFVIARS